MKESEGGFKPLFVPNNSTNTEDQKNVKEKDDNLQRIIDKIKRENDLLKQEILELKSEKERLNEEIKRLSEILSKEKTEREKLLIQLEHIKSEKEEVVSLCKEIHFQLEEVFKEFRDKIAEFIVKVLEEFSFSVPQTDILKEDLEKIFSELINYKLPLKLYINPKDYRVLENHLLSLKEKLKREGLEIQIITDDKLSMGEVHIKSDQFHIERSPKEFAKAVFEEVFRHVFKGY